MTAIDRFKECLRQDRQALADAERLALEDALSEQIPAEVLAEIGVEYSEDGRMATLLIEGHALIRGWLYTNPDGVASQLTFLVVDGERPKSCHSFSVALEAASVTG
jgi:hypothetical protein